MGKYTTQISTVVSLICLGPLFQKMTHHFLLHGSIRPTNLEKKPEALLFLQLHVQASSDPVTYAIYMYEAKHNQIGIFKEAYVICFPSTVQAHPGLPLGGRTPYITSINRLRRPKLHIKDVPRTSENSLVRPKMDIETSCLQKKPAHIYQIT